MPKVRIAVLEEQVMKEEHTENFRNVRTGISRNLVAVNLACESLLRGNVADRNGANQVDEQLVWVNGVRNGANTRRQVTDLLVG
jgi:hypothetical protein